MLHRPGRSGFLRLVGLHPCRFAIGAFVLLLNGVSGISSSVVSHSVLPLERLTLMPVVSLFPGLWYALGVSVAWQGLLTCAVFRAKQGGAWLTLGYLALALDGFAYGFALSELLFAYGQARALLLLCLCAGCGLAGIVIRLYCFIAQDPEDAVPFWRLYAPACRGLALLIALQGIVMPLCLYKPV